MEMLLERMDSRMSLIEENTSALAKHFEMIDRFHAIDQRKIFEQCGKVQTAEYSRGWIRLRQFFDRIDRNDENYHL